MARQKQGVIARLLNRQNALPPLATEGGSAVDPERIFIGGEFDEVLSLDRGPTTGELESMIRNDGQARQLASALRLPVRGAAWSIEAGAQDKGEAEFVRDVLAKPPYQGGMTTPFELVLSQLAYAIVTRQAFFEKVWKRNEKGKFVYHKLAWRPPTTCTIRADKANGTFNGFIQRGVRNDRSFEIALPPNKSFVYVYGSDISPLTGSTAFETAYKDHLQKLKVKYLYYSFLENVAYPKLKAHYTGNEAAGLRNLVQKGAALATGAVVGLGDKEDLTVLESDRTSNEYIKALQYLDTQMSKSTLSTFLDLGTTGDRGSYALSKDQSEFFLDSLFAILTEMEGAINNYLIPDLVYYNYGANSSYPLFKFQPLVDKSKDIAIEVFKAIATSPAPRVGPGFEKQLIGKVATLMQLDTEKVIEGEDEVFQREDPNANEELTPAEASNDKAAQQQLKKREEKIPPRADQAVNKTPNVGQTDRRKK